MQLKNYRYFLLVGYTVLAASCATVKPVIQTTAGITAIKFIGAYIIPHNLEYGQTKVGGLSGIDYDAKQDIYYMISDDRSDFNPARFYTARIFFTPKGIDNVIFTGVKYLRQSNGTVYPNKTQDPFHTPDPEAIRYNPVNGQLVWSSEGERIVDAKDTVLEDPSVIDISTGGNYIQDYPLPGNLKMQVTEKGPRRNGVLEGLSYADNYKTLFVSVEEPLYEDGPRADLIDNNPFIRILKFKAGQRKNTRQFAYKLEPIAHPPIPPNEFKINGVPDILSIGNNKLLVIERSFSKGRDTNTIKLFLADMNGATDVTNISLKGAVGQFTPITKKLLLNMDDLRIYIDNIEGVTFGPPLPNGHKTLLFIADNNFYDTQKSQVLLFEVME